MFKQIGIRSINKHGEQFTLTMPKREMDRIGVQNKDRVRIFVDESTGDILLQRMDKIISYGQETSQ